jgi:hypothetical protein
VPTFKANRDIFGCHNLHCYLAFILVQNQVFCPRTFVLRHTFIASIRVRANVLLPLQAPQVCGCFDLSLLMRFLFWIMRRREARDNLSCQVVDGYVLKSRYLLVEVPWELGSGLLYSLQQLSELDPVIDRTFCLILP